MHKGMRVRLKSPPILGCSTDTGTVRAVKKDCVDVVVDGWNFELADPLFVPLDFVKPLEEAMQKATCSSCGAKILWCHTERNKLMPVDAEPTPGGNLTIDENGIVHTIKNDGDLFVESDQRYTSHFATCRDAAKHRKEK